MNVEQTIKLLKDQNIDSSFYGIKGLGIGMCPCIDFLDGKWITFWSEKGGRFSIHEHESEDLACKQFLEDLRCNLCEYWKLTIEEITAEHVGATNKELYGIIIDRRIKGEKKVITVAFSNGYACIVAEENWILIQSDGPNENKTDILAKELILYASHYVAQANPDKITYPFEGCIVITLLTINGRCEINESIGKIEDGSSPFCDLMEKALLLQTGLRQLEKSDCHSAFLPQYNTIRDLL